MIKILFLLAFVFDSQDLITNTPLPTGGIIHPGNIGDMDEEFFANGRVTLRNYINNRGDIESYIRAN